jgi:hypothetical protein
MREFQASVEGAHESGEGANNNMEVQTSVGGQRRVRTGGKGGMYDPWGRVRMAKRGRTRLSERCA